ncbi:hypothetical protein CJJ23_04020 [Mycoplasmopsis agassizii]|uniref:Glycerol-3-phosphate dehydrogenase n=1 Tax=Mycoplasmopsis agassizii TaxID=33922 RepID=A0A269TJ63_9BACT|nr:NAD(P)H-dependent glycerol-3-phosphate dehydrogenase [Mycoplasmopsis agassizii]PAK21066.1 hypothetical protein CJJ23_04020 [Mycoplasmopsis agassizii]
MAKISFIGTGAYGTALANVLLKNNHEVNFYGIDDQEINDLKQGLNTKYFNQKKMHKIPNLVTKNLEDVLNNVDLIILATPSKATRFILKKIDDFKLNKQFNFINLSKGLDAEKNDLLSRTLTSDFSHIINNYAALIGPSFAQEVFDENLTMINIVSENQEYNDMIAKLFTNENFKVISNTDLITLQTYSVLKNIYALATGMTKAMHDAYNTLVSVLTLGFKEANHYLKHVEKISPESISELAAFGDFVLTATSNKSRNFSFGYEIGKLGIEEATKLHKSVTTEGLVSLLAISKKLNNNLEDFPLLNSLYQICYGNKSHLDLLDFLSK